MKSFSNLVLVAVAIWVIWKLITLPSALSSTTLNSRIDGQGAPRFLGPPTPAPGEGFGLDAIYGLTSNPGSASPLYTPSGPILPGFGTPSTGFSSGFWGQFSASEPSAPFMGVDPWSAAGGWYCAAQTLFGTGCPVHKMSVL